MKAQIFNIQKFCINDGPGIRTTVFFKGCPLRCAWCHNPESQRKAYEIMFDESKCSLCSACLRVCPQGAHIISEGGHIFERNKCIGCKKCADACVMKALEGVGKEMEADDILSEVLKDKPFYDNSGGGLTLSGGEPLFQKECALELLKKAKEKGLHTAIETCGFGKKADVLEISEYVDIFLFDYKISDSELHKKYTGVGNEAILENLDALLKSGAKIVLRCPIIPSVNDTDEHFESIGRLAEKYDGILAIEIEPYHSLGVNKSGKLSMNAEEFSMPSREESEKWIEKIKEHTNKSVKKA